MSQLSRLQLMSEVVIIILLLINRNELEMPSMGSLQLFLRWFKLSLTFFIAISLLILLYKSILVLPQAENEYYIPLETHDDNNNNRSSYLGQKVLLIAKNDNKGVSRYLQQLRIEFDLCLINQICDFPAFSSPAQEHYSIIIFSDSLYYSYPPTHLKFITNYCLEVNCAFIIISTNTELNGKLFSAKINENSHLDFSTTNSPIFHITRPKITYSESQTSLQLSCFESLHPTFQPLLYTDVHSSGHNRCWVIVHDLGEIDSIKKVYFGISQNYWLANLIFLDTLRFYGYATRMSSYSLERYILVDVDDVFLAKTELKMLEKDVNRIVESQNLLQEVIPGFKYNLGYCGAFFQTGNELTKRGDQMLVDLAPEFTWFGHIWSHNQPHKLTEDSLIDLMHKDLDFSTRHNLSISTTHYSVTPHHSGVYPVHDPLYQAWEKLGYVSVTSTEQYPSLWPHYMRRGFTYRSVSVLPRQVCGLYTSINYFKDFKGGEKAFYKSIRGGSVFETLLYNPVNIFMTHFSNYAADNLAQNLFEELISFVLKWTQIKLVYKPPVELASIYFKIFPEDVLPLWNLPCNTLHNSRHADIYTGDITCKRTPGVLLVGPQKTGSTALLSFLVNLPQFSTSYRDKETFEEIQFFSNTTRYLYGPDWYQNRFPLTPNSTLIEKSATYFDHELSPKRIRSLLPHSRIIIILRDPIERAYSWFQHQRAHDNEIALKYKFIEVLENNFSDKFTRLAVSKLRIRCIEPGLYHKHITNWLKYFTADMILFLDGGSIAKDPVSVTRQVVEFMNISVGTELNTSVRFEANKGFFCPVSENGESKCLGPGKGRVYESISPKEYLYLKNVYSASNDRLKELLIRLNRLLPDWLI